VRCILEERRPEPTAQTQLNEPAGIEIWESFQLNTTTTIDRVVLRDSCHIVKKKKMPSMLMKSAQEDSKMSVKKDNKMLCPTEETKIKNT
jgi:hypothetical protein